MIQADVYQITKGTGPLEGSLLAVRTLHEDDRHQVWQMKPSGEVLIWRLSKPYFLSSTIAVTPGPLLGQFLLYLRSQGANDPAVWLDLGPGREPQMVPMSEWAAHVLGTLLFVSNEVLGRWVREGWVNAVRFTPNANPSWLKPYEECGDWMRNVDDQMGIHVANRILTCLPEGGSGDAEG